MVECPICNKKFNEITNTHLERKHNMTIEEFVIKFPDSPRYSDELLKRKSISMMGKNKGNKRQDAKEKMEKNNPMWNKETTIKMGKTRSTRISRKEIDALKNLGHLPTEKEKMMMETFKQLEIPLEYTGDGKVWIENRCPDFINEERKIVVELDLNCYSHIEDQKKDEELYWRNGYRLIWLTTTDLEEIKEWIVPFFFGLTWEKVESVTEKKNTTSRGDVCNIECIPNNNYIAEGILVHNCFADSFRSSLYTSFFDNSKNLGLRHCKPDLFKRELNKLMEGRGKTCSSNASEVQKAISLEIPIRLGIRFEDFLPIEGKMGISLEFLRYLAEIDYPTMINTKSSLIGREDYINALANNLGGAAVHITMISSNDLLLKRIEPGAPSFSERIKAAKNLTDAGIRVVARIEPLMVFVNDKKDEVIEWVDSIIGAGIHNITFDTYSWSATAPGVKRQMEMEGIDFERMFLLMADSQWMGSLILRKFIDFIKFYAMDTYGVDISCSTFDFGNVPDNDQDICCEVGDVFKGFSYGNTLSAIRFIKKNHGQPVTWTEFDSFVESKGGWLSNYIRRNVFEAWNMIGNPAYYPDWGKGIEPYGVDALGYRVWTYEPFEDFREQELLGVI